MRELEGQLTLRGLLIGSVGCVVITASSAYVALKLGALPWPIIFAAVISLFFLKVTSGGKASLNEANVTHTIMSAGAMVAGGLAFTIPGAWMLGLAEEISLAEMTVVAISGVMLGLVCTYVLRHHYIEKERLEFPIGQAAAQTLLASNEGGATGKKLFGAMGFAGAFGLLRDGIGIIPSMLCTLNIPGIAFGIYASPMMLSVGYLVGTIAVVVWFAGATFANFGIIFGGVQLGLFEVGTGQEIVSSLGMGLMIGSGIAVIAKDILPKMIRTPKSSTNDGGVFKSFEPAIRFGRVALLVAAIALAICLGLGLSPLTSVIVVALSFVTCAMSAQSVGQTGIDPMEIFGLIVLLLVALVSNTPTVQLFFIAALIAVACGLAGDVMNDFKAGNIIGTNPNAQIAGQAIGGLIGALVAVAVMSLLLSAYGAEAFGPNGSFVSAQASVVASMVSGIPSVPAFTSGVVVGFLLYLLRFPSMMLGLGVYLPFYLSLTAFLGALAKIIFDKVFTQQKDTDSECSESKSGLIIASGLLGGESIVGIILAMVVAATSIVG